MTLMNSEMNEYINDAVRIMKAGYELILIYLLFCVFGLSIGFLSKELQFMLTAMVVAFHFLFFPIAYGRYIEIIRGENHISYLNIFKTHGLNYYSVIILLILPILPFIFLFQFIFILKQASQIVFIVRLIFEVITIFIFPLVFLLRERKKPIVLGFQCFVGNYRDCYYLILLILSGVILNLLFTHYGGAIGGINKLFYMVSQLIVRFITIIIDFMVFIVASLMLNNKLLNA